LRSSSDWIPRGTDSYFNLLWGNGSLTVEWLGERAHKRHKLRDNYRTFRALNHRGAAPRAVNVDFSRATPEELAALQLLRQLVGPNEFRRYLRYGFVMVTGKSGLRYQIKRQKHIVDVWRGGEQVGGLCVYLKGRFPPTDDVITRMLMAEQDELQLWKNGNGSGGCRGIKTLDKVVELAESCIAMCG